MRTFRIHFPGNFHIHQSAVLTTVIMLYLFITGNLYLLAFIQFPNLALPATTFSQWIFFQIKNMSEIIQYLFLSSTFYLA